MRRQGSFSQAEYAGKKKQTRRDKFLAEMEEVVPWARLVERLRPFYPKGERGRPPVGLERMLRNATSAKELKARISDLRQARVSPYRPAALSGRT